LVAITTHRDIPIIENTGSATTLWIAQPIAGATVKASERGMSNLVTDKPMQVQKTVASSAQIRAL
jgi:hypothetical protein